MYSLKSNYYKESWNTLDELIDDAVSRGMCPSCEVTFNGEGMGENLIDFMPF